MAAAVPPSGPESPTPTEAGAVLVGGSCVPKAHGPQNPQAPGSAQKPLAGQGESSSAMATLQPFRKPPTILAWVFPIPRMGRVFC